MKKITLLAILLTGLASTQFAFAGVAPPQNVPDVGSTAALLALAVGGLGMLAKKLK